MGVNSSKCIPYTHYKLRRYIKNPLLKQHLRMFQSPQHVPAANVSYHWKKILFEVISFLWFSVSRFCHHAVNQSVSISDLKYASYSLKFSRVWKTKCNLEFRFNSFFFRQKNIAFFLPWQFRFKRKASKAIDWLLHLSPSHGDKW